MKISGKRVILVGFLLFALFICCAYEKDQRVIFSCDQVSGISAQSLEELFRPAQEGDAADVILSDMEIDYKDHSLTFKGNLKYNGNTTPINTRGSMFKNEKTEHSGAGFVGNLVLAEMEDVDGWHFVQFCIDKNRENISIILQNIASKELVQFLMDISSDQFDTFYNLQDNTIHGTELEKKIVSLYSVSGNLLDESEGESGHYESPVISFPMNNTQKDANDVLSQPEFPLEEAVIAAALERAGLFGEISESKTTSYTEGHRLHVVRSLTETYVDKPGPPVARPHRATVASSLFKKS